MRARLATVRVRATIAATLVVAVALAIAGVALVIVLRSSQLESIDTTLELRASDIEAIIEDTGSIGGLSVEDDDDGFVQIVGPDGQVLAASRNFTSEPRVDALPDRSYRTMRFPRVADEEFRVHVHMTRSDPPRTIIVGTNLEYVDEVVGTASGSLVAGLPVLLLLIAALVWIVIGRALHPFEAIRSEVADIGGADLHRRVPEPETDDEIGRLARTMNAMLDRL